MRNSDRQPGQIITFYSYKGGTGRSMALANMAILLANEQTASGGRPVLAVDWDLEAPGLHRYFQKYIAGPRSSAAKSGVIELFEEARSRIRPGLAPAAEEEATQDVVDAIDLSLYTQRTALANLSFICAGCFDDDYSRRTNSFAWQTFFEDAPSFFRLFAARLANEYSYVLIDSRTGETDISGICTTLMPDKLVVVFTPNRQSLTGIVKLVTEARRYRRSSDDTRDIIVYPLPSRIETSVQPIAARWRVGDSSQDIEGWEGQFNTLFRDVYNLGPGFSLAKYFDDVQIQHVAPYAFGEPLPVLEERGSDRLTLTKSYATFRDYLLRAAPWSTDGPPAVEDAEVQKRIERLNEAVRQQAVQRSRWSRAVEWLRTHPITASAVTLSTALLIVAIGALVVHYNNSRRSLRLVATALRDAPQNGPEATALLLARAMDGATGDDRALAVRELRSTIGRLPLRLRTIRLSSDVKTVHFSPQSGKLLIRTGDGAVGVLDDLNQRVTWLPGRYAIAAFADAFGQIVTIGREPDVQRPPFFVSHWNGSTRVGNPIPWHEFDLVRILGRYALEGRRLGYTIVPLTGDAGVWVGTFSSFPDVAASDDGETVALLADSKVILCRPAERRCGQVRDAFNARAVAVSRDGNLSASVENRRIFLWKRADIGSELNNTPGQPALLVFSPDGSSLAALMSVGLTYYSVPQLSIVSTDNRRSSTATPLGIDWRYPNKLLVFYDDTIELHNPQAANDPLISIRIDAALHPTASVRKDVLAVGTGSDLVLYDASPLPAIESMASDQLRQAVCTRAGRDLTQQEWTTYFSDRPYERTCEFSWLATGR